MKKCVICIAILMLALCLVGCAEEPSPEDGAFTVTAGGEDITERFIELWNYANDLYCTKDPFADDVLTSELDGSPTHAVIEGFYEQVPNYFTENGQHQLMSARDINGESAFRVANGKVYYRVSMMSELNVGGAECIASVVMVDESDDRAVLAVKYGDPAWRKSTETPEEEYDYNIFELAKVDGVWLIDDYRYASSGVSYLRYW